MKHDFKDGKARYELNDDHNHLIDIKTGNIIEFTSEEIEIIQKNSREARIQISRFKIGTLLR